MKDFNVAKRNISKECVVGHYWFFNRGFKFQDSVCNGCHDLAMLRLNLSDIAIITVKNVDFHCRINDISKCDTSHLSEKFLFGDRGYI